MLEGDLHPEVERHAHALQRALGARAVPRQHVEPLDLTGGGVEVLHVPHVLADDVPGVDRAELDGCGGDGGNGHDDSLILLMRAVTCPFVGKYMVMISSSSPGRRCGPSRIP